MPHTVLVRTNGNTKEDHMKTKRTHIRIAAVVLAMMLVLPLSVSTVAPAYASEVENQTEEAVVTDDVKAEATEEKEIAVNGQAQIPESTEPAAAAVPQDKAEDKSPEEEAEKAAPITVSYNLNTPADAVFVPEINGLGSSSETLTKTDEQTAYQIRGLSRNLYQTQKNSTSGKISYEFMGWKSETGKVISAEDAVDLITNAAAYDKNRDGIVKLTAVWNNTFKFNGDGKYRYTTFSIYRMAEPPKTTDNKAANYMSGIYGTIAYPGTANEAIMYNWKQEGNGRVLINQESNGIGIEKCDELIRGMTETPISNYYDSRNGNEAAGYTEYEISFMDFPTDEEVIDELKTRIAAGGCVQVLVDGEVKKITKDENFDEFDVEHYTVQWFSVKYQSNGIHVDGIVAVRAIAEEIMDIVTDEPAEELPDESIDVQDEERVDVSVEDQAEELADESTDVPQELTQEDDSAEVQAEDSDEETTVFVPVITAIGDVHMRSADPVGNENETVIGNVIASAVQSAANMLTAADAESNEPSDAQVVNTSINDSAVPHVAPIQKVVTEKAEGSWAVINLIIAFITVAAAAFVLAAGKRNRILAILTAAVAAIAFFLTEDISLSLALVDRWTILMALILAVQAFMILKMGKENDESDAEKEAVLN